jgi:predicted alpha/beta hydrolase
MTIHRALGEPAQPADIAIATRDGATLAGTLYQPPASLGVAVLVNGATGVPRRFYDAFARHLAARGIAVLTYDYREHGTMEDRGRYDLPAAIEAMRAARPGERLALVGHSLGGQLLGLADNVGALDAALLVAAQSGHWRYWAGARRLRMWLLWWVLIPGLSRMLGRFPGTWLGTANLPASVALSWARWGRSPHYVCDALGGPLRPYNDQVRLPIRWLSFIDDDIAPFAAVEALRDYYPNARVERLHLAPGDLGADAVGHFGWFRKSLPVRNWDQAADWLVHATRR